MRYETVKAVLIGESPLLMHCGQTIDPLNPFAIQMKKITSKRTKTETDYSKLASLEFEAGLYRDEHDFVVIPGENVEAMMVEGGKKSRKGKQFAAAVISDGLWPLMDLDGNKISAKGLWKNPKYRDTRNVRIKKNSIMRTRPIFREWKVECEIKFLPECLERQKIIDTLKLCGEIVGLCDHRPRYGRFSVEIV